MSFTGVDSLDASIGKANAWLAGIGARFGAGDRRLAYRVLRAWLHGLRDALPVEVAAHFAAQLPELLRGVFFDGWNPSHVPHRYDRGEYVTRFARGARIRETDVAKASRIVTAVARRHMSPAVVAHALSLLPASVRPLLEQAAADPAPAPGTDRRSAKKPAGVGAGTTADAERMARRGSADPRIRSVADRISAVRRPGSARPSGGVEP